MKLPRKLRRYRYTLISLCAVALVVVLVDHRLGQKHQCEEQGGQLVLGVYQYVCVPAYHPLVDN